jgi:hypothetical protein
MDQDLGGTQEPDEAQDAPEQYLAPALIDLGSFEELTRFGGNTAVDSEGQS